MRNGYYLSLYIEIDEMANVYGIDTKRHDQNISLWFYNDGNIQLVRYWELERITRIKHHNRAFKNREKAIEFINILLKEFDLTSDDIIEMWGTPQLTKSQYYLNENEYNYHELCHLYSSLLLNTEDFYSEDILALSVDLATDGVAERNDKKLKDYVGCWSEKGNIRYFDIESPAPLWSLASHDKKCGEGTLMALASASTTAYREKFDFKNETFFENNHKKNLNIYNTIKKIEKMCTRENYKNLLINYDESFTWEENLSSATMKVIQELSQDVMERNIKRAIDCFGINTENTILAMSGGFVLNCPCNSYIMNKYKFKKFTAPPCTNDSGQSLGIALYSFFCRNNKISFTFSNAFWGSEYKYDNVLEKYKNVIEDMHICQPDEVADDIINNTVVWLLGESEIGPRALGHRSILSSPLSIKSKDELNRIKNRKSWRPVAPIVLEEYASDWFENAQESPFMLRTFLIKKTCKKKIPAVAHYDRSSRVQTINEKDGLIYDVLKSFYYKTGVPIICNTSLNDWGEPIIETPEQAINFALKKKIRVIYINKMRIKIKANCDIDINIGKETLWKNFSDNNYDNKEYCLNKEEYLFYYWSDYYNRIDLNIAENVMLIKRAYKAYSKTDKWLEMREMANFYY